MQGLKNQDCLLKKLQTFEKAVSVWGIEADVKASNIDLVLRKDSVTGLVASYVKRGDEIIPLHFLEREEVMSLLSDDNVDKVFSEIRRRKKSVCSSGVLNTILKWYNGSTGSTDHT